MKKSLFVAGSLFLSYVFTSSAALTMNWSYTADFHTFDASVTSGWLVQMYRDVSLNTVLSAITGFSNTGVETGGNTSDDLLLGSFTTTITKPKSAYNWAIVGMDASAIAGANVYTVVFNSATIAGATQAVVIDSTTFSLPASGATSYAQGSVANSYVPVGAVPEPSSVALIGVGLAAIALRRRFAK